MFKRPVNITRIKKNDKTELQDTVLIESPIDLFVNSERLVNVICLPKDLKELSIGFLYSIGIINSIEDLKDIEVNELENAVNVNLRDDIDFITKNLDINPVSRVVDTTCGISSPWRNIIKKTLDNIEVKESLRADNILKLKSTVIFSAIISHHSLFYITRISIYPLIRNR